jgi:GNAT superfamily N-acetyltransferase
LGAHLGRILPEFDSTLLLRADLSRLAPGTAPAEGAYRVLEPGAAATLLSDLPGIERADVLRRLARADRCVYLELEGQPAFWEWVQLDRTEIPPDALSERPGERLAYIYGAYTQARFRGQGLFTTGLHWLVDWLRPQGYTHLYSQSAVGNIVSLLAHFTVGFEVFGESRHIHWQGRRVLRPSRLLATPLGTGCALPASLAPLSARAQRSVRRALFC